jgi:methionine--tRNA ligase beta chain
MKKPNVSFFDFQKLDLRVGEVKEANIVEGSRNLITMQVDLGQEYGVVEIMAGIGAFYQPEDVVGKKFAFVANLEPKKMMSRQSNGMTLMVDIEGKPIIVPLTNDLPNGAIIC